LKLSLSYIINAKSIKALIKYSFFVLALMLATDVHAQLLEDRGKLKSAERKRKSIFSFLKRQSKKGGSGVTKFSNPGDPFPSSSPDIRSFIITDKQKQQGSKFQSGTSLFKGFSRGKSQRQQDRFDKESSKTNKQTIISIVTPDPDLTKYEKYQGFDRGKTKLGKKYYYKEASKEQSGLITETFAPDRGPSKDVKYKGFDKGKTKLGKKYYYKEASKEQSGLITETFAPDRGPSKDVKYRGFSKGKTKLGKKFYYIEASKQQSGLIVEVDKNDPVRMKNDNLTIRVLNRRAQRAFDKDASRALSKWEGVRIPSYEEQIKEFRKLAAKTAKYEGKMKTQKRNNKMHPSASYVYGKRASSFNQKELFRKLNVYWVRMNKNKDQPESVKDTPKKLKFDKSEKDIWNY
jgi:hypothetical protein